MQGSLILVSFRQRCSLFLATGFFLSYVPYAIAHRFFNPKKDTGAGFVGTLWGVLTLPFFPSQAYTGGWTLISGILFSVVISDIAEHFLRSHDDSRIVIDEWIGYWCSMYWLPHTFIYISMSFIFFRLFDIYKAPWVKKVSYLPGGWGIVMDDVIAGFMANGLLQCLKHL